MTESKQKLEELMSDYLDGQLDAKQCATAESMLAEDPRAAEILEQIKAIQTGLGSFRDEEPLLGTEFTDRVVNAIEDDKVQLSPETAMEPGSRRSSRPVLLGLATLAAVVLLALTLWQLAENPENPGGESIADQHDPDPSELVVHPPVPTESTNPDVDPNSRDPAVSPPGSAPNQIVSDNPDTKPEKVEIPPKNQVVGTPAEPNLKDLEKMVGLESLSKGKFLFVIEIGVTPAGVRNGVVKDILMKNGIIYDEGLEVAADLEKELLGTRYLDGVIKKPVKGKEQVIAGSVDLIYMVCTGMQVDQARLDIHARHTDIAKYRFNLAILPKDIKAFDLLHDAVNSQWAKTPPGTTQETTRAEYQERLKQWKGKAGRLMTSLVFLANPRAATSAIEFDFKKPPPRPQGAGRGNLTPPKPTNKPILGADLICEVLLVVRNMSDDELQPLP